MFTPFACSFATAIAVIAINGGVCMIRDEGNLTFKILLPQLNQIEIKENEAGWKRDEALKNCLIRPRPYSTICYNGNKIQVQSANEIPNY